MTDSPLTKQEVAEVVAEVVSLVRDSHNGLTKDIQDATSEAAKSDGKLAGKIEKVQQSLADHKKFVQDSLTSIQENLPDPIDPATVKQMVLDALDSENEDDEAEEENEIFVADTPDQLRDKLETLVGDQRLDISAIRGIESLFKKGSGKAGGTWGSSRGIQTNINGQKVGLVQYIDIIEGVGITVSGTFRNGTLSLMISANTVLIPAQAINPVIDGSNKNFTFHGKVTVACIGGMIDFSATIGIYDSVTDTTAVTYSVPPQNPGDACALVAAGVSSGTASMLISFINVATYAAAQALAIGSAKFLVLVDSSSQNGNNPTLYFYDGVGNLNWVASVGL